MINHCEKEEVVDQIQILQGSFCHVPVSFPPQNTAKQNRKISQTESSVPSGRTYDLLQLRIWDLPICNIEFYSYGKMRSNELK
jgi:hypothetical protein